MRDEGSQGLQGRAPLDRLGGLAVEVLERLAKMRMTEPTTVDNAHLKRFIDSLCGGWADDPAAPVMALRSVHVRMDDIATLYIPAAAREMGHRWELDSATFLDVTICSARLELVLRWINSQPRDALLEEGPSVLLLIPPGETHTLGGAVLTACLRKAGCTVCLLAGPNISELAQVVATGRFDLAMVSVSCDAGMAAAKGLIRVLRLSGKKNLPIVVGGPIPISDKVLLETTQADRVIRDIEQVIKDYGPNRTIIGVD